MDNSELRKAVENLNKLIRKRPWMDFEVRQYFRNKLTIYGGIDLLYSHEIEIYFENIFFVSLPIEWKTDTKKNVVKILESEESRKVNIKYKVEQGFTIFSFKPEDYPDDFGCLIGAKELSYKIMSTVK